MELQIDREFKTLIPQLSQPELDQLRDNILAEGIRDALVTWRGILLDGHNRYTIAQDYGLPFDTVELDLPDRDAATLWIVKNQLGRRNLTPQQSSYLRGKWYNEEKQEQHRPEKGDQFDPLNPQKTADRIAAQTGVSAPTVKRDARFADDVDAIGRNSYVGEGWTNEQLQHYMRYWSNLKILRNISIDDYRHAGPQKLPDRAQLTFV